MTQAHCANPMPERPLPWQGGSHAAVIMAVLHLLIYAMLQVLFK
jgi:hypothetical protein